MKQESSRQFRRLCELICAICVLFPATLSAQTVSYFPRVLATTDTTTGLALSNPSADPATITLTFYNSEGTAVGSPANVSVGSGGQIARLSTELFPNSQGQRGWVSMSSNVTGVAGFYLNGDFVLTTDGGELAPAARTITFPWIVQRGSTSTEVTLTNPNDASTLVTLTLFDSEGRTVSSFSRTVAGRAQLIGTASTLFAVSNIEGAYLRAEATDNIVGAQVVRDGSKDFAMLNARADAPSRTLIFPHIATGGGYSTALFIQNTSTASRDVTLQFFLDNGSTGANDVTISLAPGQLLRRTVQEAFNLTQPALQTGWVRATTAADVLEGFQVFLAIEPGGITALPARKTGSTRLLQSHVAEQTSVTYRNADLFTGLALLNPGDSAAEATISIVTREASILSETTQALQPRQKRALLLREMMPEALGETSGTVWVRSNVPIFGLQVFGTRDLGVLSQIPAQSTESITRTATLTSNRFAISGTISASIGAAGAALGGITIDAIGPVSARATTDYTGAFVVKNLPAGDYVVTPSRSDLAFTPANTSRAVAGNVRSLTFSGIPGSSAPPSQGGGGSGGGAGGGTGGTGGGGQTTLQVTPEEIEVRITSSVGVGAYQITINFNPALLSLSSPNVRGGTAPFDQLAAVNIDNVAGSVTVNQFQTSGSPTGTFVVARLRFTGKATGTANLTVPPAEVVVKDTIGRNLTSATMSLSATSLTVR